MYSFLYKKYLALLFDIFFDVENDIVRSFDIRSVLPALSVRGDGSRHLEYYCVNEEHQLLLVVEHIPAERGLLYYVKQKHCVALTVCLC